MKALIIFIIVLFLSGCSVESKEYGRFQLVGVDISNGAGDILRIDTKTGEVTYINVEQTLHTYRINNDEGVITVMPAAK